MRQKFARAIYKILFTIPLVVFEHFDNAVFKLLHPRTKIVPVSKKPIAAKAPEAKVLPFSAPN